MRAMHPQAGISPDEVRWIVADGTGIEPGRVLSAPGLDDVLADGTLSSVSAWDDCIVTVAGEGRSWAEIGARVRTCLGQALDEPNAWQTETFNADGEALAAAEEVLAGEFGDYVRSHGGGFVINGVHNAVLDVSMTGACEGCPAAKMSLREGFERRVKELCPAARVG